MRRLSGVLGFKRTGLGCDQAEHGKATLLQPLERLEAAGAFGVIFHEIAVHLDAVEQHFLHRVVAARAHEGRFIVAAAQMHGHRHVGRDIRDRRVDEIAVERAERVRIVAAVLHLLAVLRVAQHGDEHFVELQIAAAGIGKGAHGLFVGLAEIVEHLVERRIDRLVDRRRGGAAIKRRRRRDRHFRRAGRVGFEKLEMLQHRMAGKADLAGNLHALVARRYRGESDAGVHHMALDAVEAPEKIEMPPRAAEFAVGDRL